jgi:hypothetical protein
VQGQPQVNRRGSLPIKKINISLCRLCLLELIVNIKHTVENVLLKGLGRHHDGFGYCGHLRIDLDLKGPEHEIFVAEHFFYTIQVDDLGTPPKIYNHLWFGPEIRFFLCMSCVR